MKELDVVTLTRDIPEYQLALGDQGAIVMVYDGGFEVEFVDEGSGATKATVVLSAADLTTQEHPPLFRTKITIDIIHDARVDWEDIPLWRVEDMITVGDFAGKVEVACTEELNTTEAEAACEDIGVSSNFFRD